MDPTSTPRVGWLAMKSDRLPESSRATTAFCWFPPERLEIGPLTSLSLMSNSTTRFSAFFATSETLMAGPRAKGGRLYWLRTRFSATENEAIMPSVERSSGTNPMPASMCLRTLALEMGFPLSEIKPESGRLSPRSVSASSVWPLPCTPATPRISPSRMSKLTRSSKVAPVSPPGLTSETSSTWSATLPGVAGFFSTCKSTGRPTIMEASSSWEASGEACPTTAPLRITVILSATALTSRSLWVMKMMDAPESASPLMIFMSPSVSCGVRTAVGSSRTSSSAPRANALTISTRCWTPTGRSSILASGSRSKPN